MNVARRKESLRLAFKIMYAAALSRRICCPQLLDAQFYFH